MKYKWEEVLKSDGEIIHWTMLTIEDLKHELRLFGILFEFKGVQHEKLLEKLQFGRIIVFVVLSLVALLGVFLGGIKESLGGPLFFAFLGVFTMIHHVNYYVKRSVVESSVREIDYFMRQRHNQWENDLTTRRATAAWKFLIAYKYFHILLFLISFVAPPFIDLILWLVTDREKLFRYPTPYSGFFSVCAPRDIRLFFIRFSEFIWGFLGVTSHLGAQHFFVMSCTFAVSEIEILIARLQSASDDFDQNAARKSENLKKIVKHHRNIIRFSQALTDVLGFVCAIQIQMTSLCICFLLYATFAGKNTDTFSYPLHGVSLVVMLILTFYTCFFGQLITNQSLRLNNTLYELPWYTKNFPIQDRRSLLMMMRQANRVLEIRYNRQFKLDLERFMRAINSAYSYFTVIKSLD